MNPHLLKINNLIYEPLGYNLTHFKIEAESQDYDASRFLLNDLIVIDRTAKITPKKMGQFVTFWKRDDDGPIAPLNELESFDFFTVSCISEKSLGQFIFPKSILIKKEIISTTRKGGKRAFRVYPSWDSPTSKQALQTQKWQLNFFYIVGEIDATGKASELLRQNIM